MLFYEESYWNAFVKGTFKLFLESYFDLVMCVMLNFYAFITMDDEWSSFFATRDDALCSTITIIYSVLVLFFPLMCWIMIQRHQGQLDHDQGEFLSIIMEGVNPHNFHASMFTVYFLLRRLATGIILVALIDYPIFQCSFLMVFSTTNFIYVFTVSPLETKKENRIESFNEICILTCAHLYNIFLR
jgi:hypothetical protein